MAKQSISEAAERVSLLLGEFQRRIYSGSGKLAKHMKMPDVTMRQLKLLRLLGHVEDVTMKDLAKMAGITMPTATGLVDRMVDNGLVVRADDPDDRRVVRIKLTRKAKGLRDRWRRMRGEKLDRVMSQLTAKDRQRFVEAFETINDLAKRADSSAHGSSDHS